MKALLQGWNAIRILRLVLGIAIMVQGIVMGDMLSIILGLVFGAMAVANIGCCGTTGCAVWTKPAHQEKRIHNEELDNKK